ncbi:MAG: hypothetical protein A2Z93_12670 [Curvibacter sp. GWA2_64_110]|nr:MAG: hypothetical protein A2Z93_12670 [Curvibacter sp. GWA2_64_110]HCY14603.1 hypothetical protein [Curvibacter sp.]
MAGFNSEVFKWARESAGLDVGEAAKALHIKPESLEGDEPEQREVKTLRQRQACDVIEQLLVRIG